MKFDFLYGRSNALNSFASERQFGFIAGCVVALIALTSDAFAVIGRDSVLYVHVAGLYIAQGFQAAFQEYNWPAYSILIASVHKLTSFTLVNSAYLLNFVLILLMADAFFRLYWELFPESKFRWIPVVVFLAFTGINDYRDEIVRDWGFWAFAMLAYLYVLRAFNKDRISDYLLWQVCLILALLFRVEAIVLMLMLPIVFLFKNNRLVKLGQATSLFWGAGVILLVWLGFNDGLGIGGWGKLGEVGSYLQPADLWMEFKQDSLHHAGRLFPHHAKSHAVVYMVCGLMGVLLIKVLTKVGYGYLFIGVAGWLQSSAVINRKTLLLILFFIFVSLVPVSVFFAKTKILAGRYTVLTALLILLLIAYFFEQLLVFCRDNNKKSFLFVLACLMLINFIAGVSHSKSTKIYLKSMGNWADQNIPKSATIVANEVRLCFYSKRPPKCYKHLSDEKSFLTNQTLKGYDYLLWKVNGQEAAINRLLTSGALQRVHAVAGSKAGDSAELYKIIHS